MILLQRLKRVLRGQVRHWVEHHNAIVTELWQRVLQLPQGQQPLYKELLVASHGRIEALAGMNRGTQLPFAVDCRTIDTDGYRRLYSLMLGYYVFHLILLNPTIERELLDSLTAVCGKSEEREQMFVRLRRVQTLLPKQQRGHPDVAKFAEVWQVLKPVLKARDEPLDCSQFTVVATGAFNIGLQELHESRR